MPGGFKKGGSRPGFKNVNFFRKTDFSKHSHFPN
jgi:hypothetical protein